MLRLNIINLNIINLNIINLKSVNLLHQLVYKVGPPKCWLCSNDVVHLQGPFL